MIINALPILTSLFAPLEASFQSQTLLTAAQAFSAFKGGFQWKDVGDMIHLANAMCGDSSTPEAKETAILQALNDFIDLVEDGNFPEQCTASLLKEIAPDLVHLVVTGAIPPKTTLPGTPSLDAIQQEAAAMLSSLKDGFQWKDLAILCRFSIEFAEQYPDLTPVDKAGISGQIVDFVIDEVDAPSQHLKFSS